MKTIFDLAKEDVFTRMTYKMCAADTYKECIDTLSMFLSIHSATAASEELVDYSRVQELLIFSVAQIAMRSNKEGDTVMHDALKRLHDKHHLKKLPTTDFSTYDKCLEAMYMATSMEEPKLNGTELALIYSTWTSLMYTKDTDTVMDDFDKKYLWENATK